MKTKENGENDIIEKIAIESREERKKYITEIDDIIENLKDRKKNWIEDQDVWQIIFCVNNKRPDWGLKSNSLGEFSINEVNIFFTKCIYVIRIDGYKHELFNEFICTIQWNCREIEKCIFSPWTMFPLLLWLTHIQILWITNSIWGVSINAICIRWISTCWVRNKTRE